MVLMNWRITPTALSPCQQIKFTISISHHGRESPLAGTGYPWFYPENAQNERLATSPQMVTRLHLPNAIVVRLHIRKSNVVFLTPDVAVTVVCLSVGLSIQDEVMDAARSAPQGAQCHVDVINLLP